MERQEETGWIGGREQKGLTYQEHVKTQVFVAQMSSVAQKKDMRRRGLWNRDNLWMEKGELT